MGYSVKGIYFKFYLVALQIETKSWDSLVVILPDSGWENPRCIIGDLEWPVDYAA